MTSVLDGNPLAAASEIGGRIDGLAVATEASQGRLDPDLVGEASEIVDRARARLRLSSEHTVVAIAGATGSGKSSTFNALTGLELSAVGVRRPTTSWATACVWGSAGATELLEWLGIPDRHQTTRDSMLDTRRESQDFDGVVLLDLPDHDSTEVAHHLEVDRLVVLSDLLIWVLDPQKYADAAIHDRYLQPLREHADIMVVVLNHIDEVPEERRESMVADVRRLLDADGLDSVPVLPVSARLGWGVPELKDEIARRVADKKANLQRVGADVKAVAQKLSAAAGDAPVRVLDRARVQRMDDAIAEAAGRSAITDAVRRSSKLRVRLPEGIAVQHAAVDAEVRSLADEAGEGLGQPWQESLRRTAVGAMPALHDRLDAALASTREGVSRLPGGVVFARALPLVFAVIAVAAGVWSAILAGQSKLKTNTYEKPSWLGHTKLPVGYPLLACAAALVLVIVFAIVSLVLLRKAKRERADRAARWLHDTVGTVTLELVVTPIEQELIAYKRLREGIERALA